MWRDAVRMCGQFIVCMSKLPIESLRANQAQRRVENIGAQTRGANSPCANAPCANAPCANSPCANSQAHREPADGVGRSAWRSLVAEPDRFRSSWRVGSDLCPGRATTGARSASLMLDRAPDIRIPAQTSVQPSTLDGEKAPRVQRRNVTPPRDTPGPWMRADSASLEVSAPLLSSADFNPTGALPCSFTAHSSG